MVLIGKFVILIAGLAVGFFFGRISKELNVVELSDVLGKSAANRTDKQTHQDGVMQLKNEIASSGAIRLKRLENGETWVSIKVVVK